MAVDVKAVLEQVLVLLEQDVPVYQIIPDLKKIIKELEGDGPAPKPEPAPEPPKPTPKPTPKPKPAAKPAQTARRGDATDEDAK